MLFYNSFSGYPRDYIMVYDLIKPNIICCFYLLLGQCKALTTFQLYLPPDLCALYHIIYNLNLDTVKQQILEVVLYSKYF